MVTVEEAMKQAEENSLARLKRWKRWYRGAYVKSLVKQYEYFDRLGAIARESGHAFSGASTTAFTQRREIELAIERSIHETAIARLNALGAVGSFLIAALALWIATHKTGN